MLLMNKAEVQEALKYLNYAAHNVLNCAPEKYTTRELRERLVELSVAIFRMHPEFLSCGLSNGDNHHATISQ